MSEFPQLTIVVVLSASLLGCDGGQSLPVRRPPDIVRPSTSAVEGSRRPATRISFRERTPACGVRFQFQNDEAKGHFAILESMGGGVAICDFDGDGLADFFAPGGGCYEVQQVLGQPSALFRNLGEFRFADVTMASRTGESTHYSHGASAADFDEDGFPDLLVTGYGGVTLYRNQGDGTFQNTTSDAALTDKLWSTSAAWGDFNEDEVLDVYVAHYVDWSLDNNPLCEGQVGHPRDVCPPKRFNPLPDIVYFGNGDGTFRDATAEAGLRDDGKGIGVVAADVDLDGDLDVYVANDTVANFLYRNDGRGHFEDISQLSGTAVSDRGTPDGSMGTDVGDFNGDGLPDIWVANYEHENFALYRNQGHGLFRHVSQSVGIAAIGAVYVGWGTRFLDADLDGDEDLIVANGHVIRFPTNAPLRQHPLILENLDGARFTNVSDLAGDYMTSPHAGRGLATGDLDGDGDEDVVVSHLNEPVAVLSNESTAKNNWLAVRLIGRHSCRSSIGAVAVAKISGRSQTRQVRGGSSYASTSDPKLHFGCGTSHLVDELTVTWIGGRSITLRDLTCNQVLTVIEPAASSR